MKRIALASLVVAVVAAVAMLTTAQAATPVLKGEVGPGFTIEVKKAGKKVKMLKAGKYTFQCDPHAANGMMGSFKVTK